MIVKRGRRDDFACDFDRKTIFVQTIEILDVADEVGTDKTNDFIEVIVEEEGDEVKDEESEESEEDNAKNFDFFVCFVRTCS